VKPHNPGLELFLSDVWFEFFHCRHEFVLSSVLHLESQLFGKLSFPAQYLGVGSL
jgi:hypothetical protein